MQVGMCVRDVEIVWEGNERGLDMIIYREYLPNGKLGEMEHTASPYYIVKRK